MFDISIIVPVYNIDKYIEKCIESLINQTLFSNLEIILVNDGSTDESEVICRKYEERYSNIFLLSQSNLGVSSARNEGIKHASGKYTAFVDGDDYVEPDFFEKMLKEMAKDDNDLVIFDYYLVLSDGKRIPYRNNHQSKQWDNISIMKDFLRGELVGQNLFDKLFLTEKVKTIQFDSSIRIGEDFLFIFEYLKMVKKASGTFIPGYNYVQRNGSAMNTSFNEKMFDPVIASTRILKCMQSDNLLYEYAYAHYIHTVYKVLERAYKSGNYNNYKKQILEYEQVVRNYSIFKAKKCLSSKQLIGLLLMKVSPKLYLLACKIKNI